MTCIRDGPLVQRLAQQTFNLLTLGSTPARVIGYETFLGDLW